MKNVLLDGRRETDFAREIEAASDFGFTLKNNLLSSQWIAASCNTTP
jgi:hypothetical protein